MGNERIGKQIDNRQTDGRTDDPPDRQTNESKSDTKKEGDTKSDTESEVELRTNKNPVIHKGTLRREKRQRSDYEKQLSHDVRET